MPIDLTRPLEWTSATGDDLEMLTDLQGNILKGHGRDHTYNLFLKFDSKESAKVRHFLKTRIAPGITTAKHQLDESAQYKLTKHSGVFVAFFLTAAGYDALGISEKETPKDTAFRAGLKKQQEKLNDPKSAYWDGHFQEEIHAMLLIAAATADAALAVRNLVLGDMPEGIKYLGQEIGNQHHNHAGEGIENFGYVDGRSQPLLLVEDIQKEANGAHITGNPLDHNSWAWSPVFGLNTALVPDPGGKRANSYGSYFVFRKLEQDVKGFKKRENPELADALGLKGDARELAGAMAVGRFEDGTPVTLSRHALNKPVPNNFNYEKDADGAQCPFQGHIRKSNPRGESVGLFPTTLEQERAHIMVRRGITYGERAQDAKKEFIDQPREGVGLLFMAYQNNILNQFEFAQAIWVNNPDFVKAGTGIDPVIGQFDSAKENLPQHWPNAWNDASKGTTKFDFHGFVTMKGGEYFFAPSISFFKHL